jgi:GNAT superfamily N-acetyltransferase
LNLVAEEHGLVVAFVSVLLSKRDPHGPYLWERASLYVGFIGVLPRKQNQGIGTSLLEHVIREAADRCPNEPFLYLEHGLDNKAGRLYERIGFRPMSSEEIFTALGLYPKGPILCFDLRTNAR